MSKRRSGWLIHTTQHGWQLHMAEPLPVRHVHFGSENIPIRVTRNTTHVHSTGFPVYITARNGQWYVSPLFSILTSKHSQSNRAFRGNQANFRDIIETGRKRGIVTFVFTPNSVDERNRRIVGYTRHPHVKEWLRYTFPWPHVVYNRIPDRTAEAQFDEHRTLKLFESEPHVHLFNPRFFDKQQLIQWMTQDHRLRTLLPTTLPFNNNPASVSSFLRKFGLLYLKPADGKAGNGIIQIKHTDDGYVMKVINDNAIFPKQYVTKNFLTLFQTIGRYTTGKRYILQQGIPLATYFNRPFDMRILVQKDVSGRWRTTGVGVHIAGPKSITTHVPKGGRIGDVTRVLRHAFSSRSNDIYSRITKHAVMIAKRIEHQAREPLGELSLDLGIDRQGNFWLFEANAKPMKFDEPIIRKRSLERLFDYVTYLAGEGDRHVYSRYSATKP